MAIPLELRTEGTRAELVLRGSLALGDAEALLEKARLAAAGGKAVAIDLSEANHVHTSCLQILAALEKDLVLRGRLFEVVSPSENASRLLSLAGLGRWLVEAEQ